MLVEAEKQILEQALRKSFRKRRLIPSLVNNKCTERESLDCHLDFWQFWYHLLSKVTPLLILCWLWFTFQSFHSQQQWLLGFNLLGLAFFECFLPQKSGTQPWRWNPGTMEPSATGPRAATDLWHWEPDLRQWHQEAFGGGSLRKDCTTNRVMFNVSIEATILWGCNGGQKNLDITNYIWVCLFVRLKIGCTPNWQFW
jgi:hypothetical protein